MTTIRANVSVKKKATNTKKTLKELSTLEKKRRLIEAQEESLRRAKRELSRMMSVKRKVVEDKFVESCMEKVKKTISALFLEYSAQDVLDAIESAANDVKKNCNKKSLNDLFPTDDLDNEITGDGDDEAKDEDKEEFNADGNGLMKDSVKQEMISVTKDSTDQEDGKDDEAVEFTFRSNRQTNVKE